MLLQRRGRSVGTELLQQFCVKLPGLLHFELQVVAAVVNANMHAETLGKSEGQWHSKAL
jgi:hypothetical protein